MANALADRSELPPSQPESSATVSVEEYYQRVQALLPNIKSRTDEAEKSYQIPAATFKDLNEAGIFKVFQPRRWGGFEMPPMTFFNTIYDISEVCPSTGWIYGVINPHSWEVAAMENQAQVDIWGDDPDAIISSSFPPMGKVEKVDDGYILNGRWKYSSGANGCTWVLVGGVIPRKDKMPQLRNFLIPISEYEIVDTWRTFGLRGTGSNDIVIKDVFVPEHRSNDLEDAYYCNNPGQQVNTGPLYRMPFMALFAPLLSFAALGAAKGAYNQFVEYITSTAGTLNKGYDLSREDRIHVRIADSISDIESSKMMLTSLINEMYDYARADEKIPLILRKRVRFEAANAVERATNAAMNIWKASGTGIINDDNLVQRYVRDVLTARTHLANITERSATLFAKEAVGIAPEVPQVLGDIQT